MVWLSHSNNSGNQNMSGFDEEYYHNMLKLSLNHYKPEHWSVDQLEKACYALNLIVHIDDVEKKRFENMKQVFPENNN